MMQGINAERISPGLNIYILNFFQRDALANLSAKVRFDLEGFGGEPSTNALLRLQGAKKGEAAEIH